MRAEPPPPPRRPQHSSSGLELFNASDVAVETGPGVSRPSTHDDPAPILPRGVSKRTLRFVIGGAVVVGMALGGVGLVLSLGSSEKAKQLPNEIAPAAAKRSPVADSTPTAAQETSKVESPQSVVEPITEVTRTPACDELMQAHPARPKPSPLDYEYIHQLRTARRELVRGNVDAAHAAFCRATVAPGADINVWLEFAQLLVLRKDGVQAIPWTERALGLEPKNVRAQGLLADALILSGRTEEARRALLAVANEKVEGDPAGVERVIRRNLAEADRAFKRMDLPRAERFLRRVLAFDPQHVEARSQLARIESRLSGRDHEG